MPTVDVLRPASTSQAGAWTATGAASLWQATSDDSDASYAGVNTTNSFMSLNCTAHTPGAGLQRHRWRVRSRLNTPVVTGGTRAYFFAVIVGSGSPDVSEEQVLGTTILTYQTAWESSQTADATATRTFQYAIARVVGPDAVRNYEAYVDVDTRAAPTFTAEVHDGAGVNRDGGIVSDTSRPVLVFDSPDTDDLPYRSWTVEVRTAPGGVVVFSASGTGPPPASIQSDPLPNGDYEADLQLFSTIRTNDAYASAVENVTFEVAFVAPASPVLTVTPVLTPPAMDVDWTSDAPTATAWDVNADVVTELRRTDCNGTDTVIYVAQTGIGAATYLDRFMSLSYNGVFCGEEDHTCQVCYEARYWGEVDGVLVATEWSTEVCDTVSNPNPGEAWIRGGDSGDLSVCPDESYGLARPFGVFQPIAGGMPTVITATPGGRNYSLSIPANSEADVVSLLGILAQAIVFYQPVAQADLWLAPDSHQVQVTKVGRNRVVDVPFVAVNPQPVADPSSFF